MTLSAFLRDYLYVPLGGNRHGAFRRYLNLFLTMLLGGLWHGAGWNFVIWGGLHGCYLMVNHGWRALTGSPGSIAARLGRYAGPAATFVAVIIAWVPFRAANLPATLLISRGLFGVNGVSLPERLKFWFGTSSFGPVEFMGITPIVNTGFTSLLCWISGGYLIIWLLPNTQEWLVGQKLALDGPTPLSDRRIWRPSLLRALMIGALLGLCLLGLNRPSEFLYFQF